MFGSFFKQPKSVSIQDFLTQVKSDKRNFFEILSTPEKKFQDASFDELMSNSDDVLAEVNRVQKNFQNIFFGIFDSCLIKHHDNGDVKWIFYTTTKDTEKIFAVADALNTQLGLEHFDDNRFIPFKRKEKVVLLAQGLLSAVEHDILSIWLHNDITTMLQYKKSPFQQLSLMVTIRKPTTIDNSIRRRTILELVQQDIEKAVLSMPLDIDHHWENGSVKSTVLTFHSDRKILGIFDRIRFRQFGKIEEYTPGLNTNLTLYAASLIPADDKVAVAEKLIRLYGSDSSGTGEVKLHERDMIEAGEFWTGRNWYFNEQHGLLNNDNSEKMSYLITLDDFGDEERFKISVLGYDCLVELFGIS